MLSPFEIILVCVVMNLLTIVAVLLILRTERRAPPTVSRRVVQKADDLERTRIAERESVGTVE